MAPRRDRFAYTEFGEIESALDDVDADPDKVTVIQGILANLATIEATLTKQHGYAVAAGVEEAKGVRLNANAYEDLRTAGLRECEALAAALSVKVFRNPFASGRGSFSLRVG